MQKMTRFKMIVMVFLSGVCVVASGQNPGGDAQEMSVENLIIHEQSRLNGVEMKLIALEYIKEAIERGNTGPEIQNALEYLAMEGILNEIREDNRVTNNYPQIRARVAEYLGDIGTPEAQRLLIRLVRTDKEPMVLQEAIKSLGRIADNDSNEIVTAISEVIVRKDNLHQPDNLLTLSALDVYDKIAKANGGRHDFLMFQTLINIAGGNYSPTVRNRAKQVLANLWEYALSGNE
jgi:HEAT repeat protein